MNSRERRVIHLALRWVMDRYEHAIPLWGARHPDQLNPVSEVLGWKIDEEAMKQIDAILAACVRQPVGPEFMAPPERRAA